MKKVGAFLCVAIAALSAWPATATILRYTISGTDSLSAGQIEYASFRIDTDRLPDQVADGIGFAFTAIPGTFTYGGTTTSDAQDISFFLDADHGYADPDSDPGGLFVGEGDLLGYSGPQLFTGPIDRPTLLTGPFTLIDAFSGSPISLQVSEVAEPASWMLMIAGFGAIGAAARRTAPTGRPRRFEIPAV